MNLPFTSIIPKTKEMGRSFQLPDIIFYLSVFFVIISLLVFFLLHNSVKKATNYLSDQEKTLASQKTQTQIDLEKNVLGFKQKLKDFDVLLKAHSFPSNIFTVMEKVTHPKVSFAEMKFTAKDVKIKAEGIAQNYQILAEQLTILQKDTNIKNFAVSEIELQSKGDVKFILEISFDPKILNEVPSLPSEGGSKEKK